MANISLNRAGVTNANSMVRSGKVNKTESWSFSTADGNKILGDPPDWKRYGSYHLGITPDDDPETKAHWHYPFGKNGQVYRSGLIAIRSRAAQQGDTDVFEAAGRLIENIDKTQKAETLMTDIDALKADIEKNGATAETCDRFNALCDEMKKAVTGAGGGTQQAGPGGYCKCPECGERVEHKQKEACTSIKCPKCGAAMQREGYEPKKGEGDAESEENWPMDMNKD